MASVNSATWTWPADVLEFAREKGIEPYLEPLREAARQAFPTMKELRVYPSQDLDDPNHRFLVWEIVISKADSETHLSQTRQWYRDSGQILPAGKRLLIVTFVIPVCE
jgi:hypothetical protein